MKNTYGISTGSVVLLGGLLMLAALFLPVVGEAIFPAKGLSGWMMGVLGAAALFDLGQDNFANVMAGLFLSNLMFVISTLVFPILKRSPLMFASRSCILILVVNLAMTLYFSSDTRFAIGQYFWLSGMSLVSIGFYLKTKRKKA